MLISCLELVLAFEALIVYLYSNHLLEKLLLDRVSIQFVINRRPAYRRARGIYPRHGLPPDAPAHGMGCMRTSRDGSHQFWSKV